MFLRSSILVQPNCESVSLNVMSQLSTPEGAKVNELCFALRSSAVKDASLRSSMTSPMIAPATMSLPLALLAATCVS